MICPWRIWSWLRRVRRTRRHPGQGCEDRDRISWLVFPAALRVGGDGLAVELEAGGAVDVGGEGADFGGFECFEDFHAGMAVAVAEAARDDGPLRGHASEELGARGGEAAVMAYLEQRALKARLCQHGLLNGGLGVAFEKDRG